VEDGFYLQEEEKVAKSLPLETLKREKDFKNLLNSGLNFKTDIARFFYSRKDNFPIRYGIVVSKKLGNSVTRNKIRRLFREALRIKTDLIIMPVDFVIMPYKFCGDVEFSRIVTGIDKFIEFISKR